LKTVLYASVCFAILGTSQGCNPFEPDQSVILDVSRLEVPATIAPANSFGAVLTVTLGGCLSFDRIDVVRSASDANVTVWGRDAAKGRSDVICPQNIISETHSLQFNPPFANTFTITVNQGRVPPLVATVNVQ